MGFFLQAIAVASDLIKMRDSIREARAERRNSIADYFGAISVTLQEIQECLANSKPPDYPLGKLREYARQLPQVCEGFLAPEDAQRLSEELVQYWPPAELVELMEDDLLRDYFPDAYLEAAGKFKALADSIRASP